MVVVNSPHGQVGVAVAVHVARPGHAVTHEGPGLVAFQAQGGPGRVAGQGLQAGAAAVVEKCGPFVYLAVVVGVGSHGQVGVAVAVHVTCPGHASAQQGSGLVAFQALARSSGVAGYRLQAGGPAVVNEYGALVGLPVVVGEGPHGQVGVAVAVQVARTRHALAQLGTGLVAFQALGRPGRLAGQGLQAGGPAIVEEHRALVGFSAVVEGRTGHQVGVAVAVHVARARHGIAQVGGGLVAFQVQGGPGRVGGHRAQAAGPAVIHEHRPFVGLPVVVGGRAHGEVGVAVAVHVAQSGHAGTQEGTDLVAFQAQRGPGRVGGQGLQTRGPAVIHEHGPFIVLAAIVAAGPHGQVGVAVAVEVARAGHAPAHKGPGLVAFQAQGGPGRATGHGLEPGGPAVVEEHGALVGLPVIVAVGAHGQVGVAVAVEVARAGHTAQEGTHLVAFQQQSGLGRVGGDGLQAAAAPIIHKNRPFVGLAVVVVERACGQVGVAVTVEVARPGHADAQLGPGLVAFQAQSGPGGVGGHGLQARGPAVVEEHGPFVGFAIGIERGAHGQVGVAVGVHVAQPGHGPAQGGPGLVAFQAQGGPGGVGGHGLQAGAAAVVDEDRALVGLAVVVERCAHGQVGVAVAVEVAGAGRAVAQEGIVLVAFQAQGRRAGQGVDGEGVANARIGHGQREQAVARQQAQARPHRLPGGIPAAQVAIGENDGSAPGRGEVQPAPAALHPQARRGQRQAHPHRVGGRAGRALVQHEALAHPGRGVVVHFIVGRGHVGEPLARGRGGGRDHGQAGLAGAANAAQRPLHLPVGGGAGVASRLHGVAARRKRGPQALGTVGALVSVGCRLVAHVVFAPGNALLDGGDAALIRRGAAGSRHRRGANEGRDRRSSQGQQPRHEGANGPDPTGPASEVGPHGGGEYIAFHKGCTQSVGYRRALPDKGSIWYSLVVNRLAAKARCRCCRLRRRSWCLPGWCPSGSARCLAHPATN